MIIYDQKEWERYEMEDKIRIIEVKRSIFADNDADAERLRQELKEKKAIDVVGPDYIPYKDGKFLTPSEKAEFWVRSWKEEGFDPIASYARAEEDARNDNELARKYPLFSVQQKTYRSVHSTFNNLEWMD